MIDNDKCEDSVPQCGIIAHSGFVDHKRSENKSRWDGMAQKRTELSGMRWMRLDALGTGHVVQR